MKNVANVDISFILCTKLTMSVIVSVILCLYDSFKIKTIISDR